MKHNELADGQLAKARHLSVMEARERIKRPRTIRPQIPDMDVFRHRFDRMPRYVRGPYIRRKAILSEQMRQGACWVEPAVPVAVRIWRWV